MDHKLVGEIKFANDNDAKACGTDDRVVLMSVDRSMEIRDELRLTFLLRTKDIDSGVTLSFDSEDFRRNVYSLLGRAAG